MSAPVVTLFEAYGAGAQVVGPQLADRLGVPFVGQAMSSEDLEAREDAAAPASAWSRALAWLGRPGATQGLLAHAGPDPDGEVAREGVRFVIDAAREGAVILGRNATVILGDDPRVFHVKLDGPVDDRIARAAGHAGIDLTHAHRRQVREDRMRAEMSMRLHNWDPRTNDRFDLVVNTFAVPLDAVAELVVAARQITLAARS